MEKNSFVMYTQYGDCFDDFTDEEAGRLIKAIFRYHQDGSKPMRGDIITPTFRFIQRQMDRDQEKWAEVCRKRAEAGRKGGLSRAHSVFRPMPFPDDAEEWDAKIRLALSKEANACTAERSHALSADGADALREPALPSGEAEKTEGMPPEMPACRGSEAIFVRQIQANACVADDCQADQAEYENEYENEYVYEYDEAPTSSVGFIARATRVGTREKNESAVENQTAESCGKLPQGIMENADFPQPSTDPALLEFAKYLSEKRKIMRENDETAKWSIGGEPTDRPVENMVEKLVENAPRRGTDSG